LEIKALGLMAQRLFVYGQQGNLVTKMGFVALLVVLLALASTWKIWSEIKKIDVSVLRSR
jgi:hypothetical protein